MLNRLQAHHQLSRLTPNINCKIRATIPRINLTHTGEVNTLNRGLYRWNSLTVVYKGARAGHI